MKKVKRVPRTRFIGFTNEWVQSKIDEHCDIKTGGTPKTDINEYWYPKEIPWMSSGEVSKKRLFYTDNHISKKGLEGSSARWVKEKSILIALAGQGKTRGAVAINEIALTTNQSIAAIEVNSTLSSEFIFQNLISRYEELRSISSGDGSRGGLNKKLIADIIIFAPRIQEQIKIGVFLKKLDDMITLQLRKLEKTKALKSAYLAEMFPAEGERMPERRFAGFTDAWDLLDLQDACYLFDDGDWIESKDQSITGIRLIQTGNIGVTNFVKKEKNKKWVSDDTFKKLNCNEVFPGDILISRLPDPAGRACIIPELGIRMITSVDCTIIRTFERYSTDFLVQYLATSNYFKAITTLLGGGTRQRISRSYLAKIKVPFPKTVEEQQKIGVFFKQLDDMIANHQRKLEKLKATKQAYLHEMFV